MLREAKAISLSSTIFVGVHLTSPIDDRMRDQVLPQGEARALWSSGAWGSDGACCEIGPEALARLIRGRKALGTVYLQ